MDFRTVVGPNQTRKRQKSISFLFELVPLSVLFILEKKVNVGLGLWD